MTYSLYLEPKFSKRENSGRRYKNRLITVFSCTSINSGRESLADAIAPFHFFISKGLVKEAQRSGLFLFTWVVDSEKRAQWMKDLGINGIVTNRPDLI
jgi:glycerophosphoryl diester phosphodiesterase